MRLTCLLLVAACNFDHGAVLARTDGNGTPSDVGEPLDTEPVTTDAAIDGSLPPSTFCDPAGGTLVACYPFENNAQDGSGHNLNATTFHVMYPNGKVGKALQLMPDGAADVAESTMFDTSAITIEAWIRPTQMPGPGLRAGILDNNGQYGFFFSDSGRLSCTLVNGPSVGFDNAIQANTWTHVACAYDGANSALYVNGHSVATGNGGAALGTNGTSGISIAADNPPGSGSRLVGLIDQLRIFSVARTTTQICEAANGDDCQ